MKTVIIGAVAGGATAAARLRRLDEKAEIVVLERGGYVSFANCGLPYYIGGTVAKKEQLLLQTPESFYKRYRVEVRLQNEVTSIDREKKQVIVQDHTSGRVYAESYDKLIISPGAEPKMRFSGAERIFSLRDIPDTLDIKAFIDTKRPKSAIILGGGYIGLEMAENLAKKNIRVTIIQRSHQLLNGMLDSEMAAFAHNYLRAKGIRIFFDTQIISIAEGESSAIAQSEDKNFEADMIISAVGITPEGTLAQAAGLAMSEDGHILVNQFMQTDDENIYALGDVCQVRSFIAPEKEMALPLAGPANKEARLAADHICGIEHPFKGVQGTSILGVLDLVCAATGFNEKTLQAEKIPYKKIYVFPGNHAGFYPDSKTLSMKLLFRENGEILGAQIVGFEGTDKRIDIISTAIHGHMTVSDLAELELAYAPAFGSAKDAVNIAGYVAQNYLEGLVDFFYPEDIADLRDTDGVFLDVRTQKEFERGHIEGAAHIPVDSLRERMNELDKSKPLYVYCGVGLRGYVAYRILVQEGFKVSNLAGGMTLYNAINEDNKKR